MYAGLDVGSRTIKLVTFDTVIRESLVTETGVNPLTRCQQLMSGKKIERLVVTGYGRHLVAPILKGDKVTEIKAFAVGARYLFPDCRTILDIGGQDSKVIQLSESGEVQKFEMKDRCAAGTGKFLEIMANTLEVGVSEIGDLALGATKRQTLTRVLLPMASPGILTGFILAMARAAGEVAPLMITGVVKLAPSLPLDGNYPFVHLNRKFMHLGFHIYDIGFQSPNVEAAKPMVYVTTLLLVLIVLLLTGSAIRLRNRMRRKFTMGAF